nr:probable serine/threonine-protein kinase DDB_G0275165 [Penaeus vannamei]
MPASLAILRTCVQISHVAQVIVRLDDADCDRYNYDQRYKYADETPSGQTLHTTTASTTTTTTAQPTTNYDQLTPRTTYDHNNPQPYNTTTTTTTPQLRPPTPQLRPSTIRPTPQLRTDQHHNYATTNNYDPKHLRLVNNTANTTTTTTNTTTYEGHQHHQANEPSTRYKANATKLRPSINTANTDTTTDQHRQYDHQQLEPVSHNNGAPPTPPQLRDQFTQTPTKLTTPNTTTTTTNSTTTRDHHRTTTSTRHDFQKLKAIRPPIIQPTKLTIHQTTVTQSTETTRHATPQRTERRTETYYDQRDVCQTTVRNATNYDHRQPHGQTTLRLPPIHVNSASTNLRQHKQVSELEPTSKRTNREPIRTQTTG